MYFSVNELIGLPGMPGTAQGVRLALKKLAGNTPELVRKRQGTKAFEYHIDCLPVETQDAVRERHFKALLASQENETSSASVPQKSKSHIKPSQELELMRQCPALLEREVSSLTAKQKQIADARALLAGEVERLRLAGMSRAGAVKFIATESRKGLLPAELQAAADIANARKGSSRKGVGERSLQEWLTLFLSTRQGGERLALLAPGHLKARKPEQIKWLPDFLAHWRSLNGPSLQAAYRSFEEEWQQVYADQPAMIAACPSYDAVRRAMEKLPKRERVRGRVSGSAALAYQTYQKRDWSQMPVNGCWIADGKSLNLKVAHPVHGRPFTPEMTLVIDGRSRFVVGWSLSLSETMIAVADAYRHGMSHYGKPLFVYSDNGGGEANRHLDADITGIFPRMGITHMTSIPGRPQSRGIIERLNAVIPRAIAQKFDTYNGHGADREHVRMTGRAIQSAVNALEKGKPLNAVQRTAIGKLPSWQQLIDVVEEEVHKYNQYHQHSELPKRNGKHMTPAEYRREVLAAEGDEIEYLTDLELREMFMPEMVRKAQRGWVELMTNQYFSEGLLAVDGEDVRVAFDIHDPQEVIIRRMDGTYVCTAIWDGNKHAAIPVSHMERSIEQRRQRRLKRIDEQRKEIEAEARPLLESKQPDFSAFIPADYTVSLEKEPNFFLESERDAYLKKAGNLN
ncbi:transposase [Shigella sonnei]|nr:transposase [Shigella sonnei]EKY7370487.1 transposase [Shigella sonnei]EME4986192.1 transposase [Shigella sonnei]